MVKHHDPPIVSGSATPSVAHAPGKHHRKPPPSIRGAKHSDESVAKAKSVVEKRRWARD